MLFLTLMLGTLVSEDLACIVAGLLIREGRIGFVPGVAACALGILAGDVGLWFVGRVFATCPRPMACGVASHPTTAARRHAPVARRACRRRDDREPFHSRHAGAAVHLCRPHGNAARIVHYLGVDCGPAVDAGVGVACRRCRWSGLECFASERSVWMDHADRIRGHDVHHAQDSAPAGVFPAEPRAVAGTRLGTARRSRGAGGSPFDVSHDGRGGSSGRCGCSTRRSRSG